MGYLIIAVVLVLIVAPLFRILPSKAARQSMAVRRAAMARGVAVELTSIEDPNPNQDKYRSSTGRKLATSLPVAAFKAVARKPIEYPKWCIVRQAEMSVGIDTVLDFAPIDTTMLPSNLDGFLSERLGDLPVSVQQIAWDGRQLVVYWLETGLLSDGEKIFTFLDEGLQWLAAGSGMVLTHQQDPT